MKILNLTSIISLLIILLPLTLPANNLVIQNTMYDDVNKTLEFDLSYDNAFNTTGFETRVYLFVKYKNSNSSSWQSMSFPQFGHNAPNSSFTGIIQSHEYPNGEYFALSLSVPSFFTSGSISTHCTVVLSEDILLINPSFKVFGIEMIRSNSFGYQVGDGTSPYRFHRGDDINLPFTIPSPVEFIEVGNSSTQIGAIGTLPVSTIPSSYVFKPTYIMRYEITQQQYVDFLNCLSRTAQNNRTGTDISGTAITNRYVMSNSSTLQGRNGIRCDATLPAGGPVTFYCDLDGDGIGNGSNDGQNISANYLLPADLMAFLDWAGLQPLNEMQYEAVCRGTDPAVAGEYAWGTIEFTAASLNGPEGGPEEEPTNVGSNGLFRRSNSPMRTGAAATATTDRVQAGASFWGVMDLSGNAGEMVIGSYQTGDFVSISPGDGVLDPLGNSNQGWPGNLTVKGLAPSNSVLYTVSRRHDSANPYISNTVRSSSYGGRGIL